MKTDWLQEAEDAIQRAREARAAGAPIQGRQRVGVAGGAVTLVIRSVLPNGGRLNPALHAEMVNTCDFAIIAAAQGEAIHTGQREFFQLTDGTIGSVDADGNTFADRPPQG